MHYSSKQAYMRGVRFAISACVYKNKYFYESKW